MAQFYKITTLIKNFQYSVLEENYQESKKHLIALHLTEIFSILRLLGFKEFWTAIRSQSAYVVCMVQLILLQFCNKSMVIVDLRLEKYHSTTKNMIFLWLLQMVKFRIYKQRLTKLCKRRIFLFQLLLLVSDQVNLV